MRGGLGERQADRHKDRFSYRPRKRETEMKRRKYTDGFERNQTRKEEDRHEGRQRQSDGPGADRIQQRDWLADGVGGVPLAEVLREGRARPVSAIIDIVCPV